MIEVALVIFLILTGISLAAMVATIVWEAWNNR